MKKKIILFTGDYLPDYNRTRIIRKGLQILGYTIVDYPFTKKNSATCKHLIQIAENCDFIFMPSFTHKEVKWVKSCLPNKKLIFDPLISRHMTRIYDYKLAVPFGFSALRNFLRDKRSMNSADFVVTDTEAHRQYFHKKFGVPLDKMGVMYIGNDFDSYKPGIQKSANGYLVGFYGGFIPLQGVMNILKAAQLLLSEKEIQFELVGSGFEFEKATKFAAEAKLYNVHFPGWLKEDDLAERIRSYNVCLGIFGDTLKSDLVIPNKIYHYAACAKPIITKDSPAVRELFIAEESIYLCGTEPKDIANKILWLKKNPDRAKEVGQSAYEMLLAKHSADQVGKKLIMFYNKIQQ